MKAQVPEGLGAVVLSVEESIAARVRVALAEVGLDSVAWDAAEAESHGRPPVPVAMLVVQTDSLDITALLRTGESHGWLRPGTPVMVIAGEGVTREARRDWLQAGAWEVIRPPVDEELLTLQVRNFLRGRLSRATRPEEPYMAGALLKVAEENLALARRHRRPLAVAAFALDWGEKRADPEAIALMERLSGTAQESVRGSDLLGVTPRGTLLALLPETDRDGALVFQARMIPRLENRLREWGVLARVVGRTSMADLSDGATAETFLSKAEAALDG